jgi:hypothetical protein
MVKRIAAYFKRLALAASRNTLKGSQGKYTLCFPVIDSSGI